MSLASSFLGATLLGSLLSLLQSVPWSSIFLLTQCFGIRLYTLRDREVCLRVQRRLRWASHTTDASKLAGYSAGRWYFLCLSVTPGDSGDRFELWMVATAASYEALTTDDPAALQPPVTAPQEPGGAPAPAAAPPPLKKQLQIFARTGSYFSVWFRKRKISIDAVQPRPAQEQILGEIEALYKQKKHAVVYVHGPPGTGKSMLGPLLAFRLNGSYCNTLKPWQPGDTLAELYNESEASEEKPLIVSFDEFDGALVRIHTGIEPHKHLPTLISDKASWNHFLDEIGRGMYPHLVLLLTSNRGPDFIRSLDPSYIREGRVNLVAALPA
jgi:hypothetical protein